MNMFPDYEAFLGIFQDKSYAIKLLVAVFELDNGLLDFKTAT
jgi:hypothetical protein